MLTNEQLSEQATALPKMPIPCHSYPHTKSLVEDEKLYREIVRATRSASSNIQYVSKSRLELQLAAEPETLVMHFSPYAADWPPPGTRKKRKWLKDDWIWKNGAPLDLYQRWFYNKCRWLRKIVGSQPILCFFDHEIVEGGHWPTNKNEVDRLLNNIVGIAQDELVESEFCWYNYKQVASYSYPPISDNIYSDYVCMSAYSPAGSHENHLRLTDTLAAKKNYKFMPCVSTHHYENRSYVPHGGQKRSGDTIIPNHHGAMWEMGRDLRKVADAVMFYPKLFKATHPLMPELFLEFCRGMAGIHHEHIEGINA